MFSRARLATDQTIYTCGGQLKCICQPLAFVLEGFSKCGDLRYYKDQHPFIPALPSDLSNSRIQCSSHKVRQVLHEISTLHCYALLVVYPYINTSF